MSINGGAPTGAPLTCADMDELLYTIVVAASRPGVTEADWDHLADAMQQNMDQRTLARFAVSLAVAAGRGYYTLQDVA